MAVDKKSQYVGNHGGAYVDMDGMRRQFTVIDHDRKTKVYFPSKADHEENSYREALIQRILQLPPSVCPSMFSEFTIRGEVSAIKWNESKMREKNIPLHVLRSICTLCENRLEMRGLTC